MFDEVYVVHPEDSGIGRLADLLQLCTPLGLVVVNHQETKEIVKPKPNPFMSQEMKDYFLARLDTLDTYTRISVNPVQ